MRNHLDLPVVRSEMALKRMCTQRKPCMNDYLESDNNGRWTIYKLKQIVAITDGKVDTSNWKVATFRMARGELETLIMEVCKDSYKKMEDVANEISKSVDYLKNKIFPGMIKAGKLEKRFPFTHNHPEQGYKTNEGFIGC